MSTKTAKNNEIDENVKETENHQPAVELPENEETEKNSQDPAKEGSQQPASKEPEKTAENEVQQPKVRTGTVANAGFVRLRKFPSATAQVLTVLNEGDKIEIIDKVPGYYQVKTVVTGKETIGYVAEEYFKED
jgi:archaellum component FlaD/FlaE